MITLKLIFLIQTYNHNLFNYQFHEQLLPQSDKMRRLFFLAFTKLTKAPETINLLADLLPFSVFQLIAQVVDGDLFALTNIPASVYHHYVTEKEAHCVRHARMIKVRRQTP